MTIFNKLDDLNLVRIYEGYTYIYVFLCNIGWLGGVAASLLHLITPIGLILTRTLGSRKTVVLGTLLTAGGLAGLAFSSNLILMFIFYGVGTGTGCCLLAFSPIFLLADYFPYYHPRHVTATSLILCGFSAGLY